MKIQDIQSQIVREVISEQEIDNKHAHSFITKQYTLISHNNQ